MARSAIPIQVLAASSPTSPVQNAELTFTNRPSGTFAEIFETETGGTKLTQPLKTNSEGKVAGWLNRGAYQVEVKVSGRAPYIEYLDIATASDKAVDTAWLADESITLAKVASSAKNAAAGTASLRSLGVGATEGVSGSDSRLANERVPTDGSVTSAKLANASIVFGKIATTSFTNVSPFSSGWAQYSDSTYGTVSYAKEANGKILLRGLATFTGGVEATTKPIFTLPSGFRPSKRTIFICLGAPAGVQTPTRVDVTATGEVIVNSAATSFVWVSLDPIEFYPS